MNVRPAFPSWRSGSGSSGAMPLRAGVPPSDSRSTRLDGGTRAAFQKSHERLQRKASDVPMSKEEKETQSTSCAPSLLIGTSLNEMMGWRGEGERGQAPVWEAGLVVFLDETLH